MLIQVLKSKLKDVIVTAADTEYDGSITLDEDLMDAAGLYRSERVEVNAVNGESRISTYVIPGKRGSGCVELNGGAANFFVVGQHIHVNSFGLIPISSRTPQHIVITDENNKVID